MKNTRIIALSLLNISLLILSACNTQFGLKEISEPVDIHSEHQAQYLADPKYDNIGKYSAYSANEGYANPLPVKLSWQGGSAPYVLKISEDAEMSNPLIIEVKDKSYDFYNPLLGQTYYWNVTSKNDTTETSRFTIKDNAPRNIYLDGVDNVRDLGGYTLSNGKKFKQGLLYRSAELNKNNETSMNLLITGEGLETVEAFGIKTDIDLRRNYEKDGKVETSGIDQSPLGGSVNYVQAPMHYGGENFLENSDTTIDAMNKASIKLVFETLADRENLPAIFHCVQGKDRTGCIAYLIEALLGVDNNDIHRDYLFTNFSKSVGSACKSDDIDKKYGLTINRVEGETLSAKAYKYLNETLGISETVLDAVISNLSE